jgi:hypothetical protein
VAYGIYKHYDHEKDEKTPNKEIDGTHPVFDPVPGDAEAVDFHELPATEVASANKAATQANQMMMAENFGDASYEQVNGEAVSP